MEKTKDYNSTRFRPEVIREAHDKFIEIARKYYGKKVYKKIPVTLEIELNDETLNFDNIEEFLSKINVAKNFFFHHIIENSSFFMARIAFGLDFEQVKICLPEKNEIDSVFNIFEKNLKNCLVKKKSRLFNIFIGHGHNKQWRDLKDHLSEKHGFSIISYEIGPKAGITIKDTLEIMLNKCNYALLVFTGEDIDIKGQSHARENVIHELGLFQGRLGFDKAIILLEEGVEEFSNIVGLNQYRFSKGNIKEIFGDVVASINHEIQTS